MAPQIAYRQSQAALESDAAARRQTQSDDIASGYPRLVEKAVARGLEKHAIRAEWAMVVPHSGTPFGRPLRTRL